MHTDVNSADEAAVGLQRSTRHIVMSHPEPLEPVSAPVVITARGRKFALNQFQLRDHLDLLPNQSLCTHPGCRKGWTSFGALDR